MAIQPDYQATICTVESMQQDNVLAYSFAVLGLCSTKLL